MIVFPLSSRLVFLGECSMRLEAIARKPIEPLGESILLVRESCEQFDEAAVRAAIESGEQNISAAVNAWERGRELVREALATLKSHLTRGLD